MSANSILRKVITCSFLFVFVVCSGIQPVLADKSYRITAVDIEARLRFDGSLDVNETRTYTFDGSYSFAFRKMPRSGPVRFNEFSVSENGRPYRLSDEETPGTYRIIERSGETEIRWFFWAEDMSRSFTFHYRATDAVVVYDDAAVLYYQFISPEWDRPNDNVTVRLSPPTPISPTDIQEWLHGPLWGVSRIEGDGTVTARTERLPRFEHFEIRALYPATLFPGALRKSGSKRESILREEAAWADEANREREEMLRQRQVRNERWSYGRWVVLVLSLAGFIGWWQCYSKYGRRPTLPPPVKYAPDLPDDSPPAVVDYLLHDKTISGGGLIATLFHLAQRNVLSIRQEDEENKGLFGGTRTKSTYHWDLDRKKWKADKKNLIPYEDSLIRFLFDELGEGEASIDFKTIQKNQAKFTKFFTEWKKQVKLDGDARNWFDQESFRGMWYSLSITGALFVFSIAGGFVFGPWAGVTGGTALIILILSFFIPHRTIEGARLTGHWNALKRYLKRYQYRSESTETVLERLDDYFIYGLVLGLDPKVFRDLAGRIPSDRMGHFIPWYIYHGSGSFTPDAFATSFSSMMATATSTMSTAAGTGGGASSGGGGGAGSGGGGAG